MSEENMQTKYVQFYNLLNNGKIVCLQNGFSYIWDKIKKDNVWVKTGELNPPISKGHIYASCWYSLDIDTVIRWKKNNPELTISVGGPISIYPDIIDYKKNKINLLQDSAENVFGVKPCWNLEIPKEFRNKEIRYTFSFLENNLYGSRERCCYWGECVFCRVRLNKTKFRGLNRIPIINHPMHKYIWLNFHAIPPEIIKELYPTFDDRADVTYITYARADSETTKALSLVINNTLKVNPKFLEFNIGIEFPSNRMLKIMNKGTTKEEYLNFIKLASNNNIKLVFTLILNWPEVIEEDVKEVEEWLNKLSKITDGKNITAILYPLGLNVDSKMEEMYKHLPKAVSSRTNEKELWRRNLFAKNHAILYEQTMQNYTYLVLDPEKRKLNNRVWKMYKKFPFKYFDDTIYQSLQYQYGMGKI